MESTQKECKVSATVVSELEKLLYFDNLFRHHLDSFGNTIELIMQRVEQDNKLYGTSYPASKNSIRDMREKLYGMGANFIEKKGGARGTSTLYEYEDPNQEIKGLKKLVGKMQKAKSIELLNLLESQDTNSPLEVWTKLFLKKIINEGEGDNALDYVSFNENLDLTGINEYFETLLEHIINKQPIEMGYQPFGSEPRIIKMHPYFLKMYNQRWFILGKVLNENPRAGHRSKYYDTLGNFAIDRISPLLTDDGKVETRAIKPWNGVTYIESGEDFRDFFYEMIGVTDTGDAEDVILRFTQARYNYVKTKPLTPNQTEMRPGSEYYHSEEFPTVRIHVKQNRELVQQILSFGKDVEVIAPKELRDKVRQEIENMLNNYKL